MAKIPASFVTISGLPDDFDFWITGGEFGYRTNYKSGGAELVILHGESPDVELADDHEELLSIGKGWEIKDDGKRVSKGGKANANFASGSRYGTWLHELGKMAESNQLVAEWMNAVDKQGLTPRDAEIWKGVGLHLKRVKVTRTIDGETKESDSLVPTAFLGYKGSKGTKAPTKTMAAPGQQTAAAEAAGASDPAPAGDSGDFPGDPAMVKTVRLLCLKSKDRDSFQLDASQLPGIGDRENEDLLALILEDGATGFWARVKGS